MNKRKKKPKSESEKLLKKVRDTSPIHVVEIELEISKEQDWKLQRIQEHIRLIRNTVLGELYKNYKQMIHTKKYKRTKKRYKAIVTCISKTKNKNEISQLEKEKKMINKQFEELSETFQVTFEFARKHGEIVRRKFNLPDSVSVLSVCENVWASVENLMYGDAENPYFYKKDDIVTIQGKQAERCVIVKYNQTKNTFTVTHNGMVFPLSMKKNDLFIEETLSNIVYYLENGKKMDGQNVERFRLGKSLLSTYRVRNNRIIRKNIRGKNRYYVQIVLEGLPVTKRRKDGSFRHNLGKGKVAIDIGTQSIAIVNKDNAVLKNLAERSDNTFSHEHKVHLIQQYLDRSRRAMNPKNFYRDGTIKKGRNRKTWVVSTRYKKEKQKLKELHRKAAESRKYAHNEDINKLRSFGDLCLIEQMNIKGLKLKAKEVTVNEKTGKCSKRKRYGKSIGRRSPGYFIIQLKHRFNVTGGCVKEVNTWTFKASQYDHVLNDTNKKQLSQRWHVLPDGRKVQRDLYSAFLLYCANEDLMMPNQKLCLEFFDNFYELHNHCIRNIKDNKRAVQNSGIKISKVG